MHETGRAAAERRRKELLRIEIDPQLDERWAAALAELQERTGDVAAALALVRAGDIRSVRPLIDQDEELQRRFMALSGEAADAAEVAPRNVTWRDDPNADAADFVMDFVDGVLGVAPDAARGRLLLRPRMSAAWQRAVFDNIRIGDAFVRLEYERTGAVLYFTIVQVAGAYPIRLIFEPVLPQPPRYTFVDGKPASLNSRAHSGGTIVPVQIMLDEKRVVAFEMAGP